MQPVLCIGETLIDLIATDGSGLTDATTLAIREGGAPMNVAVGLSRLDFPAAFCGVTGNDPLGQRIRLLLEREGVNTQFLGETDTHDTSIAYAWKDAEGDGQFRLLRQADCRLTATFTQQAMRELQPAAIVVGSVAMATGLSRLAVLAAIREAHTQNIPIVVDLNIRMSQWPSVERLRRVLPGLIRHATVLKLSVDDATNAWDLDNPVTIGTWVGQWTASPVVITDGARGTSLYIAEQLDCKHFPAFAVNAVEPTGAGDAFTAALISRLLENNWRNPTAEDIRFAMAAGAITTTRSGALASLPDRAAIETFLAGVHQ